MQWQDWIFSTGSIIFSIALVPSVLGKDKPALSTSLMTGTILAIYIVAYISLSLWFSAATSVLIAGTWFLLAYQKYRQDKTV